MPISRRHLGLLLPALAAAQQTRTKLPSKVYHHGAIPYTGDATKKARRFFYGVNRGDFNLEMHETILGPGVQTHPPHQHIHEEIMVVVEGTVEIFIDGKTEVAEAGSVVYYASNQMHNATNVGKVPSRYYIIELRGPEA